jgi:hypothetical protein
VNEDERRIDGIATVVAYRNEQSLNHRGDSVDPSFVPVTSVASL